MTKIDHIAIWTKDIEKLKAFYQKYFKCTSNKKYINKQKTSKHHNEITLEVNGKALTFNRPVIHRYSEPDKGER